MKKLVGITASLVLSTVTLTGCGGSSFCDAGADIDEDSADVGEVLDALEEAQDEAPSEIQDDVDLMVVAFQEVDALATEFGVDALDPESVGALEPEQLEEYTAAAGKLSSEEFSQAAENITDWENENC
jgi:predicted small secreted protein